jgi:hypothetical protein
VAVRTASAVAVRTASAVAVRTASAMAGISYFAYLMKERNHS